MASIVVYFSRRDENYVSGVIRNLSVGNTEAAAQKIQKLTGADCFSIEPMQPYSKNYNECIAEAQADQRRNARPALKNWPDTLDGYDTVYLGYPNYWGTMPMAVFTFLEHFDLTGKTVRPFCTHEGSGMGSSISDIRSLCPGVQVEAGLAVRGGNVRNEEKRIKEWINSCMDPMISEEPAKPTDK